MRKKSDDIFIGFDTIPECDGHVATAIAMLCYASCEQQDVQLMLTNPCDAFIGNGYRRRGQKKLESRGYQVVVKVLR